MAGLGLFGLGAQRQRSTSSSTSQSTSASQSSGFNIAGSGQEVFGANIFSQLFGDASAAANAVNPDALSTAANRLFDSGTGFIDELAALSGGDALGAGEQYLAGELGGGDGLVAGQIDQLKADLGAFFTEDILPGIRSDAIAAGALGGGRQGVAEGIAGGKLLGEFTRGALGLRQGAQDRRTAIAQTLAGLQTQRRLTAAGAGLTALPQQYALAEAGTLAALSPFMTLAQIIGGPTALTESFAMGQEQASSYSQSTSSSQSESKGKGFQLQLGAA